MVHVLNAGRPMMVAPPPRPSRVPMVLVVVLALLVLLVAGVVGFRALVMPSAQVTREPVATAGANPFMPSVGVDQENVKTVANVGRTFSGSTPGLYGGSGDNRVCDRSQLSRFLDTHADKADGWAAVLGVNTGSIDSYVASLTPVVLRSDTFVTNHGWHDGEVTSFPSVLQAGTAVLVDAYGSPVVRCFCGNPLSAPASFHDVSYIGPTWVSFSVTNISVVTNTTVVNNNYTLVDVHNGRGYDRPRGTEGEHDHPAKATDPTTTDPTTNPDPSTPPVTIDNTGNEGGIGPSSDTSAASQDPATLLTSGTWNAGPSCPTSLAGSSLSFSGGSFTGGPGGTYTLTGKKLTLTPTVTSNMANDSTTTTSSSTPTSTASPGVTSSGGTPTPGTTTSSAKPATPKPVTLTLSTTSTPATFSGASCTLTHAS